MAVLEVEDGWGNVYRNREILEHLHPRHDESPRDMFFRFYGEHPRVDARMDRRSTFAADVDTASYAIVRRLLSEGHLPPRAAVRTEEFVNALDPALPAPTVGDFAIHVECAPTPFAPIGTRLLRIGLRARDLAEHERPPLRLVFVVDCSGSMQRGNRLDLVQRSLELLVDQLEDEDQVAIVAFEKQAECVLPPTAVSERWRIREALRGLRAHGSTNAASGLFLGMDLVTAMREPEAHSRIVFCSDGVANTGETDQARILDRMRRVFEQPADLTVLGVGLENHDDVFLEQIANQGNGACHYVDDFREARRILVDDFSSTLFTLARDARIQVEFDPATVLTWRQLGYENRALADADFRNATVDAGEIGPGHTMVGLYEVELAMPAQGRDETRLATVRLRWHAEEHDGWREIERQVTGADLRPGWRQASRSFRETAALAQFAEILRRSYWARGESLAQLGHELDSLAYSSKENEEVRELRALVARTRELARQHWHDDDLHALVHEARRCRLLEARLRYRRARGEVPPQRIEELLEDVRRQNDDLERRLREALEDARR